MAADGKIPDSTDINNSLRPDSPSTSQLAAKKAKRQTAFYPNINSVNKNPNPFSRSAAKRQSVMALGSIEHLQHYFTKAGIAAQKKPQSNSNLVPAIGGPDYIRTSPSGEITKILEHDAPFVEPPQPMHPQQPAFLAVQRNYETDPELLKPGVVNDLIAVSNAWKINAIHEPTSELVDVLSLLRLTTRAIRSVRNYVMSLPDETFPHARSQQQYRPSHMRPPLPNRSSNISSTSTASIPADPLSQIRKSALEVLSSLHKLEETTRLPLTDDAYDAQSEHGSSSSRNASHERINSASPFSDDDVSDASFCFSVVKVPGRSGHIRVWSDEDDELLLDSNEDTHEKEKWDEKIVLGSGWLYRQDVGLASLSRERAVVGKYLDTVDAALFDGRAAGEKRGWDSVKLKPDTKRRRPSNSGSGGEPIIPERPKQLRNISDTLSEDMANLSVDGSQLLQSGAMYSALEILGEDEDGDSETREEVPDDDLPDWARRSSEKYSSDPLGRAYALLIHLLPATLLHTLPLPDDSSSPVAPPRSMFHEAALRTSFLQALTSGQLLCVAYNSAVRRSRNAWGFINPENVHDVLSIEANAEKSKGEKDEDDADKKVGWTFRRIDNLRLWTAALKLRYSVPIASPGASSQHRSKHLEAPLLFDARAVARRDLGWDTMLETLLLRWVEEVVQDKRNGR